ncbi:hypothetical protein LZ31DRAFT_291994 [Colletotrichum somersetense]|nr:hypothetical protein LZ31DRAFT_291994 [Colletotrichum somersetense]
MASLGMKRLKAMRESPMCQHTSVFVPVGTRKGPHHIPGGRGERGVCRRGSGPGPRATVGPCSGDHTVPQVVSSTRLGMEGGEEGDEGEEEDEEGGEEKGMWCAWWDP